MSKNILFRGQTRKKGEKVTMSGTPIPSNWVFGGIFPQNNGGDFAIIYQQDPEIQKFPVYAETVCQYTGKNDKYGGKIFENDIITYVANINASNVPYKGNVFYSETLAAYIWKTTMSSYTPIRIAKTAVRRLLLQAFAMIIPTANGLFSTSKT